MGTYQVNGLGMATLVSTLSQLSGRVVICNHADEHTVQAALNAKHIDDVDIVVTLACPPGAVITAMYVTSETIGDFLPGHRGGGDG